MKNYKDKTMKVLPLFGDPIPTHELNYPLKESIAVDASCSGNPGYLEFRGILTSTGEEIFKHSFQDGTNNIGEFLAVVEGLSYIKEHELDYPVYTDSTTAICWVKEKRARTTFARTNKNTELFLMIEKAEKFLQSGDYRNLVIKWRTREWGEIPADYGRK